MDAYVLTLMANILQQIKTAADRDIDFIDRENESIIGGGSIIPNTEQDDGSEHTSSEVVSA
jgi:hypothetical protein